MINGLHCFDYTHVEDAFSRVAIDDPSMIYLLITLAVALWFVARRA